MGDRASFRIEGGAGDPVCRIDIHDPALLGHDARFELVAECTVSDRRGIDRRNVLHEQAITLTGPTHSVRLPRGDLRGFSYRGKHVQLRLLTRLVVDDGVLFDTELTEEQQIDVGLRPAVSGEAKEIVEPRDRISFFANLQAIPPRNRTIALAGAAAGVVLVVANALVGVHDQLSPEALTWWYSHRGGGATPFPLADALLVSGAMGTAIWAAIRRQLRQYMEFHPAWKRGAIRRGQAVRACEIFGGSARVPLEDVTLRVVAANMERGQYKRNSGSEEITVSFAEPSRAVVLYAKRVAQIPAGAPLGPYFDEPVDFDLMFRALYPPFNIGGSHGLSVYWEVQLLHPRYADQELRGADLFEYEDFLGA